MTFNALKHRGKELDYIYDQHAKSLCYDPSLSSSRELKVSQHMLQQLGTNYHVLTRIISFFDLRFQVGVWGFVSKNLCEYMRQIFPAVDAYCLIGDFMRQKYKDYSHVKQTKVTFSLNTEWTLHAIYWQNQVIKFLKQLQNQPKQNSIFRNRKTIGVLLEAFLMKILNFIKLQKHMDIPLELSIAL
eukprot:gb/GECH01010563.1/.p1 GENE.gb/GECH01010563.1/~~gb/GECH01010563.1/.p1  ORF type:complete len:186 (+),score=18.89 gb/GECH01010563.1/:1-558(+)